MKSEERIIGEEFVKYVDDIDGKFKTLPSCDISDIFIIWSGGCDSTALILYLWEKYHKKINLISIVYDRLGSFISDTKSKKKLLKEFENRGILIEYNEIKIEDNTNYEDYQNRGGISQPQMFLTLIGQLVRGYNRLICFGYIRKDDFWHYSSYFESIFNLLNKMSNSDATLYMPFEWVNKEEILWYLNEHKILKYCSHCDGGSEKDCGCCATCITYKNSLRECKKKKWDFYSL